MPQIMNCASIFIFIGIFLLFFFAWVELDLYAIVYNACKSYFGLTFQPFALFSDFLCFLLLVCLCSFKQLGKEAHVELCGYGFRWGLQSVNLRVLGDGLVSLRCRRLTLTHCLHMSLTLCWIVLFIHWMYALICILYPYVWIFAVCCR